MKKNYHMREMIGKTYHTHVNLKPHFPSKNESNTGCKYHVQRIHRGKDWRSGIIDFGTCSRLKLWMYLLWLKLHGYRKDKWS
jgi:hypothetical protein